MEKHGIDPLFYMPLDYLESGYLDPTVLSDPANTNQIFYSSNELAPPSPRAHPYPPAADQRVMGEGNRVKVANWQRLARHDKLESGIGSEPGLPCGSRFFRDPLTDKVSISRGSSP